MAIHPETNEVVSGIPVGKLPSSIAVGEGRCGCSTATTDGVSHRPGDDGGDSVLFRVDPETNAVAAAIELGEGIVIRGAAVGEGRVWVTVG